MPDDPNRQLGPYVEGMLMGMLMAAGAEFRLQQVDSAWTLAFADAPDGLHALYFISPSGLRWRIRAVLEESAPVVGAAETRGGNP